MPEHRLRRRHSHSTVRPLHLRAADDLRFIRETMERSSSFTAVPGWGQVAMGLTALAAAWMAQRQPTSSGWLHVWLGEALIAVTIALLATSIKAQRSGLPLTSGPVRKFALASMPSILAAAVLTVILHRAGLMQALPGTWLLLYGTGILAGGAFSVASIPVMGGGFMLAGVVALFSPPAWGNLYMAAGFGLLHIGFGIWIARRHGG